MKKFLAGLMIAVAAMGAVIDAADARPLGGGRSFGRQSQNVARRAPPAQPAQPMRSPTAQPNAAPAVPPAVAPRPASPWRGILGGALLGLGLGALFSHFGLSSALGSMLGTVLMLALLFFAVTFIIRMFRRKDTPANQSFSNFNRAPQPAYGGSTTPDIGSGLNQQRSAFEPVQQPGGTINLGKPADEPTWGLPADFDKDAFLRQAKSTFIRMQAAWDKGDVSDLHEFTAPEVFAELRMQITERQSPDFTDVVSIDAELLGIEDTGGEYMASVRFNGMIKSAPTAQPEPFAEVWNMVKPKSGTGGWVLAGIQQLS